MAKTVELLINVSDRGGFKKIEVDAQGLRRAVQGIKTDTQQLNGSVVTWTQAAQAVDLLQQTAVRLHSVMKELTASYQVQLVAETQLHTIMAQRMSATDLEIQKIKELCSTQQQLGVIGDEVQLSGAQQMATFLNEVSSLEVLIPAMNNLIAQQAGLNATTQDAVSIGNMMGKAMQGQTTVLQRVGITFSEAQKEILQYGNESERAAILAEVIRDNVGEMNAQLAATDAGKQKQLENTLGDIREQIGALVQGTMPFITLAAQTTTAITGIIKLLATLKALGAAFKGTAVTGALLTLHEKMQTVALNLLTSSSLTATAGTWALNAATAALYATLTLGLSAIVSGLVSLFTSMGDEAENTAHEVDVLKESSDAFSRTLSDTRAEIDMEINTLSRLIGSHANTARKVEELNRKYGETFGYHKTAAEWYGTLVENSKTYCRQLGYEAQAKVLASQIAAAELEKEQKQVRLHYLNMDALDKNGRGRKQYELIEGGQQEYLGLQREIRQLDLNLLDLNSTYDLCINRMSQTRQQMASLVAQTELNGQSIAIDTMTYEELGRAIDANNDKLKKLAPTETAEAARLKKLNELLSVRKATIGRRWGLDTKSPAETEPERKPVADPGTYDELATAIAYYEKQLKQTDVSEKETIERLSRKIEEYRRMQQSIVSEWDAASRPRELLTLEEIDREITYQQNLRKQATVENIASIDREIGHLNRLRTAFETASHTSLGTDQIRTYSELEAELSFYEAQLKTAAEGERATIQQRIHTLKQLRTEWDDALEAMNQPADVAQLQTIEELDQAIAYHTARRKRATQDEMEDIGRILNALELKRAAYDRLADIPAMQQQAAELSAWSGHRLKFELELVGLNEIQTKIRTLQQLLADTENPLGERQRTEVKRLVASYQDYEAILKRSQIKFSGTWGAVKGLGNGIRGITDALQDNGSAWERVTGVIDGMLDIYQQITTIVEIIRTLTAASAAHAAMKGTEAAAETAEMGVNTAAATTAIANSAAVTAATSAETTAHVANAAAKTMSAHASIPWVGIAIGAGFVASLVAVMASLPKFADGGIAYGPTLGIFGEYAGASHNPEVVAPLDRLRSLISPAQGTGEVTFRIEGRTLVGILKKMNRIDDRVR